MADRALSPRARPSRLVATTSVMRQTRVRFGSLEDICGAKALSALGQKQTYAAQRLAKGERARAFKAVSPGLLSPLAIIFGLFVAFTAAQVWSDSDRANAAIDGEASALRAVVVLAAAVPGVPESQLRALVRRHIER
jgi:hypothetical protein